MLVVNDSVYIYILGEELFQDWKPKEANSIMENVVDCRVGCGRASINGRCCRRGPESFVICWRHCFYTGFFLFLQLLICLYNRHKIPRFYIKVKRDGSVGAIHLIINSSSADNCMYLDFYTTTIWTSFVSTLLSDAAQSSKTLDINRSSWPPYIDYCRPTPKSIIILIHDAGLFSSYSNLC